MQPTYTHKPIGTNVIRPIFLFEQEEISYFIYLNKVKSPEIHTQTAQ